jgi:hypothetical protein
VLGELAVVCAKPVAIAAVSARVASAFNVFFIQPLKSWKYVKDEASGGTALGV